MGYTKLDNVFLAFLEDIDRAQAFADCFPSLDWPKLLEDWARQVNPLLDGLLKGQRHYWVTAQSEYATDILFSQRAALKELIDDRSAIPRSALAPRKS